MLAHAFTLGRRLGKLTVAFDVAGLRFAEAPARAGFFERDLHDAVVRALPDYAQPVAIAGYETGWRINELLSREWRHLEAGVLRLDPGETKNGDGRTFPLTGDLLAVLKAQRARVKALEKQLERIVPHVFPYVSGRFRGQRVGDFGKAWATACKAAGAPGRIFPRLPPHRRAEPHARRGADRGGDEADRAPHARCLRPLQHRDRAGSPGSRRAAGHLRAGAQSIAQSGRGWGHRWGPGGIVTTEVDWWTMQDLNLRPLACEASALPTELIVRA